MKLSQKIVSLILFMVCLCPLTVKAASYYGVVNGVDVRIRKSPGYGDTITYVSTGTTFDMPTKDKSAGTDNCSSGWYQVYYSGSNVGYICADYFIAYENSSSQDNATPSGSCQTEMKNAGFPSAYWSGLCNLKAQHPNWKFVAVKDSNGSAVDFNKSVMSENCRNRITTSAQASYKTSNCSGGLDSGYTFASSEAISYYMNPTNFFNEKNIFMFEGHQVNNGISSEDYKRAATNIFNNNYFIRQIPNVPNYIQNASAATGVSQTAIAARVYQELGSANLGYTYAYDNSSLYSVVSGNFTSRTGEYYDPNSRSFVYNSAYRSVDNYYNFFNVAAYDGSGVTEQALAYAYNHGWGGSGNKDQDRQTAMTGGAAFLRDSYVNAGQNTIYFQKFNVYPTTISSRYLHQYMTNIQAPVSESSILYNAYKSAGLLNSSFTFYIPVYNGLSGGGTVINDGGSSGSNSGSSSNKPSAQTIVNNAGLKYDNGLVANLNPGTSVDSIKNSISGAGGSVYVTDANGNEVNGNIGTGYRIVVNGEVLLAVIYGDASGDGEINALDLLKIQKNILGTVQLNGVHAHAADVSHDGQINALDLLKVQKKILGSGDITQN